MGNSAFTKLIVALDRKAAKDGTETPKFLEQFSSNICLQNLLSYGDFSDWTAGDSSAPDGWTLDNGAIAKESSVVYVNTYSAKLTRSGSDAILSQNIAATRGMTYFQGRTVTVAGFASGVSGVASIRISDGVDSTEGTVVNTAAGVWDDVSVTHVINASATQVKVELMVKADSDVYWDGIMAVEGELIFAYTPQATGGGGGGPSTDTLDNVCDRGAVTDQAITTGGYTTTGASSLGNTNLTQVQVNSAFTLPTADGSPDQVLTTDGGGVVTWETPSASNLYHTDSFVDGDLSSGVLTVNHALSASYLHVSVYDNTGDLIIPTKVSHVDADNITIDLTGYGTLTGTWQLRVSV